MNEPEYQESSKDSSAESMPSFTSEEGGKIAPVVEQKKNAIISTEVQSLRRFFIAQTTKSILKLILPFSVGLILLFQQQLYLGLFLIGWSLYISGIINEEDIEKALELAKKIFSIKDVGEDRQNKDG